MKTIAEIMNIEKPETVYLIEGLNLNSAFPELSGFSSEHPGGVRIIPAPQYWAKESIPLLTEQGTVLVSVEGPARVSLATQYTADEFAKYGVIPQIISWTRLNHDTGRNISVVPEQGQVMFMGCLDCIDDAAKRTYRTLGGRTSIGLNLDNSETRQRLDYPLIQELGVLLPVREWENTVQDALASLRTKERERELLDPFFRESQQEREMVEAEYRKERDAAEAKYHTASRQMQQKWKWLEILHSTKKEYE